METRSTQSLLYELLADRQADEKILAVLYGRGIKHVRVVNDDGSSFVVHISSLPYFGNKAKREVIALVPEQEEGE